MTSSNVNNRKAGDLRRHCTHYDVTVMNAHRIKNRNALMKNICLLPRHHISLIQDCILCNSKGMRRGHKTIAIKAHNAYYFCHDLALNNGWWFMFPIWLW